MTTTSTFQGMNTDSKPSSRVLNPPGGGSSNIFGGYEDNSAQQRTPVKNNPDNVNRGNNDIFHQGTHPAASTPHIRNNPDNVNRGSSDIFNQGTHAAAAASGPKSRAPRSGEDSFHTLFGNGNVQIARNEIINPGPEKVRRMRHKSPDTFSNVFGESCSLNRRQSLRKLNERDIDSYSRIFGPNDIQGANVQGEGSSAFKNSDFHSSGVSNCSSVSSPGSINSKSNHSVTSSRVSPDQYEDANSSFSRVFGKFLADTKPSRSRRFCDRSAYNPITGECYDTEPPKTKQEAAAPVFSPQTDGNSVREEAQESAGAGARPEETNTSKNQQASTPQTQGGIFGSGTNNTQDHRSTRVSQPPGGKSTKLW